jgi:undecaprenyl diphosphate synthase
MGTAARPATTFGHLEGAKSVRRAVEHARRSGVRFLTLHAFSSDNWSAAGRVRAHELFRRKLVSETPRLLENGVRLSVVGRRDRLSPELRRAIDAAERETADCGGMTLRLAVDYLARHAGACRDDPAARRGDDARRFRAGHRHGQSLPGGVRTSTCWCALGASSA